MLRYEEPKLEIVMVFADDNNIIRTSLGGEFGGDGEETDPNNPQGMRAGGWQY